jgi:hypothetical protein
MKVAVQPGLAVVSKTAARFAAGTGRVAAAGG